MSGLTYQVGIKLQLRFRKLKFWEGIRQSLLEKLEDSRSNWILYISWKTAHKYRLHSRAGVFGISLVRLERKCIGSSLRQDHEIQSAILQITILSNK